VIVKLPFGADTCPVDLRGLRVRALGPSAPPGRRDPGSLVQSAVDSPLDRPPLAEICRGRSTAAVVVPDATRSADLPKLLPVVIDRLSIGGIPHRGIAVVIACGTHPPVGDDGIDSLLGPLPDGITVVEHDSRSDEQLLQVGELDDGTPVRLNRRVVECELLVTVGAVRHHYFAGFGGGPKMVFPGVAGYREIQANHARVFDRSGGEARPHPACQPGILDGNPVAEEIARLTELRPPDCALCLVPGSDGRMAWAAAGSWPTAFSAAVDRVRQWYEVSASADCGLMVASAGGHPSDASLIQAHKALDAACRFLVPGGELLLAADLGDGAGSPAMEPFLADPRPERITGMLDEQWVQYGHTALRIVDKTSRYRVFLRSRLDSEVARRLGFIPVEDPAEVIGRWRSDRAGETVATMRGAAVYPSMRGAWS
jgi:nickel-dependent lactate racemase